MIRHCVIRELIDIVPLNSPIALLSCLKAKIFVLLDLENTPEAVEIALISRPIAGS